MATSKTIQPTGETISISAMTDRPDMSVVASGLSKITDAVNAENQALSTLNSNLDYHNNDFNPTYPTGVSGFGANPTQYGYTASTVFVKLSVKMENVTSTGYNGRIVFNHNIPNKYCPSISVPFVGMNGEASGITLGEINASQITIYPMKTGTTYCQVLISYPSENAI